MVVSENLTVGQWPITRGPEAAQPFLFLGLQMQFPMKITKVAYHDNVEGSQACVFVGQGTTRAKAYAAAKKYAEKAPGAYA
jgi:hypothetical protein